MGIKAKCKYIYWSLFNRRPQRVLRMDVQLLYWFKNNNFKRLTSFQQDKIFYKFNCDINRHTNIHPTVVFPHPVGVVVGSGVTICENAIIHQNVTLGMKYNENKEFGVTIGAGTRICANTVVVGNVTIGKNCVIGANSIITKSIPDNSVVVGANKIIRTNSMDSKESK